MALLSEIWNGIEYNGSFLIAGSLLCSTHIDTIYAKYLDYRYHGEDLPGQARRFISARQDRKDLVKKKVADRVRYLEELELHGIIEETEDSPGPTVHPLIQEKLIAKYHQIFANDDPLCTHEVITAS
jgi:hypothetical protein